LIQINQMVATKRPVRMKAPPEFRDWVEKRQHNIEGVRLNAGVKANLTMMETMRIIARTDGVDLPDFIVKELKKKR